MSNVNCKAHNKAVQTDNSRAVCLVVSLSLNFTTRQTARELRLTAALSEIYGRSILTSRGVALSDRDENSLLEMSGKNVCCNVDV